MKTQVHFNKYEAKKEDIVQTNSSSLPKYTTVFSTPRSSKSYVK